MPSPRAAARRLLSHLPHGRMLPDRVWESRHRLVVRVAVVQALLLGVASGVSAAVRGAAGTTGAPVAVVHGHLAAPGAGAAVVAVVVAGAVLLPLALAGYRFSRPVRAVAATTSLMVASMVLVHLTGGLTEAHFHFFVMVGLAALYQDWAPFGAAIVLVLAHHVGAGVLLSPAMVFSDPEAHAHPVVWAAVHATAVLALSGTYLASWRLHEQQGLRDALTGLGNRVLLHELVARHVQRETPVSVLYLDLDGFKGVNDTYGHAAGDGLLRAVADRLRSSVRPGDVVVRLGGDEFAVAVPAGTDAGEIVARRVLEALREPVVVDGRALVVRASIGVAGCTPAVDGAPCEHRADVEEVLQEADMAMYTAKSAGGAQVAVFTRGLADRARRAAGLAVDLADAVRPGADLGASFRVHFQALVDLTTGEVSGFEALVRWQHPEHGLVPPLEFVPLAEESGAVVPLGAWVLEEAAARAVALAAEAGRPLGMSVNVSPRQLEDPAFVATVEGVLDRTGLEPRRLVLEVTESSLVADVDATVARLQALRDLGVRIAIDDFGTGYSSLAYLRSLPADIIKVDRSFVEDLEGGGTAMTLVSSVVELAASLDLVVVAEGVEQPGQAQVLTALGCGYAQGYLYARPTAEPVVTGAAVPVVPAQATAPAVEQAPTVATA
ncbi:putative bifunctional diguanylate cyclase/phosphodiesterase [Pseudokineococcus lusitanus]|uniref:Diguanylate cyclase (GGDEF)-like protein n=1 Tax=Pseudokineococcus lusitanus TaxID=763993 RepID=A0A3N1G8E7_9ACTN|nr:EAL domain-containing protein [Pseudokineococcus lusitanus]ROP26512.1 diguanylate cyclase (GGDEF)-like protein [Pseudokineococcus lusitanus]